MLFCVPFILYQEKNNIFLQIAHRRSWSKSNVTKQFSGVVILKKDENICKIKIVILSQNYVNKITLNIIICHQLMSSFTFLYQKKQQKMFLMETDQG